MIKTVTKMTLSVSLLQELQKDNPYWQVLLVNRGFNIYDNKTVGTIPASVAERTTRN